MHCPLRYQALIQLCRNDLIKKRRFHLKISFEKTTISFEKEKQRKKQQNTTKKRSILTLKRRLKRRKLMKTKKTTTKRRKLRFLTKYCRFFVVVVNTGMRPQLQSTGRYIIKHSVKILHVRLGGANNMRPLSWGTQNQNEKIFLH